jgi:SWI/SNF-related matrix-associated actin-dependent regulator of chromatin subfamily A3
LITDAFAVLYQLVRGCVTPDILEKLARVKLERVPGYKTLRCVSFALCMRAPSAQVKGLFCPCRPEDQAKIRMAVGLRRVDPADIPLSAKHPVAASGGVPGQPSASTSAAQKRKAPESTPQAGPSRSQPTASQGVRSSGGTRTIRIDDDIEEVVPEQEEVKDELYVSLLTNVVGIQYYKGG